MPAAARPPALAAAHTIALAGARNAAVRYLPILIAAVAWELGSRLGLISPLALRWPVKKIAAVGALIVLALYLTVSGGDVPAMRALKGGAQAYLLKGSMQRELLDVIRDVHAGRRRIGQDVATELADHATDISEERRLCYVGITRAQRKLYLTHACTRISRGASRPRVPSRFLLEIPDELLEVRDLGEEARQVVPANEMRSLFASLARDD